MNITKFRNMCTASVLSVAFLLLSNLSVFSYNCQTIRNDVIRLHILANSDSDDDQQLKLAVRDNILSEYTDIFENTDNSETAREKLQSELKSLNNIAQKTVSAYGYDYKTEILITDEYFSTRVYDNITMPAGKYTALKIVIGEGEGKNWWCVLFPSICLPAAEGNSVDDVFSISQQNIIGNSDKYEIRFKIFEYIELLKNRIDA